MIPHLANVVLIEDGIPFAAQQRDGPARKVAVRPGSQEVRALILLPRNHLRRETVSQCVQVRDQLAHGVDVRFEQIELQVLQGVARRPAQEQRGMLRPEIMDAVHPQERRRARSPGVQPQRHPGRGLADQMPRRHPQAAGLGQIEVLPHPLRRRTIGMAEGEPGPRDPIPVLRRYHRRSPKRPVKGRAQRPHLGQGIHAPHRALHLPPVHPGGQRADKSPRPGLLVDRLQPVNQAEWESRRHRPAKSQGAGFPRKRRQHRRRTAHQRVKRPPRRRRFANLQSRDRGRLLLSHLQRHLQRARRGRKGPGKRPPGLQLAPGRRPLEGVIQDARNAGRIPHPHVDPPHPRRPAESKDRPRGQRLPGRSRKVRRLAGLVGLRMARGRDPEGHRRLRRGGGARGQGNPLQHRRRQRRVGFPTDRYVVQRPPEIPGGPVKAPAQPKALGRGPSRQRDALGSPHPRIAPLPMKEVQPILPPGPRGLIVGVQVEVEVLRSRTRGIQGHLVAEFQPEPAQPSAVDRRRNQAGVDLGVAIHRRVGQGEPPLHAGQGEGRRLLAPIAQRPLAPMSPRRLDHPPLPSPAKISRAPIRFKILLQEHSARRGLPAKAHAHQIQIHAARLLDQPQRVEPGLAPKHLRHRKFLVVVPRPRLTQHPAGRLFIPVEADGPRGGRGRPQHQLHPTRRGHVERVAPPVARARPANHPLLARRGIIIDNGDAVVRAIMKLARQPPGTHFVKIIILQAHRGRSRRLRRGRATAVSRELPAAEIEVLRLPDHHPVAPHLARG